MDTDFVLDIHEYTTDDIVELANHGANGDELLDMTVTQEMLYWRVKDAYDRYKSGAISKGEGATLKEAALRRYATEDRLRVDQEQRLNYMQDLHKRIELAAEAYATSPSIETADALFKAVYDGAERKKTNA